MRHREEYLKYMYADGIDKNEFLADNIELWEEAEKVARAKAIDECLDIVRKDSKVAKDLTDEDGIMEQESIMYHANIFNNALLIEGFEALKDKSE